MNRVPKLSIKSFFSPKAGCVLSAIVFLGGAVDADPFFATPLFRYGKEGELRLQETNGVMSIVASPAGEEQSMIWLKRGKRLKNNSSFQVSFSVEQKPLSAGVVVCDEPNPSLRPAVTGTMFRMLYNFDDRTATVWRGDQMEFVSAAVTNQTVSLCVESDSAGFHFFLNSQEIYRADTVIPHAWFGVAAEASKAPCVVEVADIHAENLQEIAEASLRRMPKLSIMNYIPWHPSWSFISERNAPGKDQPVHICRDQNRHEEYREAFTLAASNGFDAVMVDIAVVKWWESQMPLFQDMADVINQHRIPVKLIFQIDSNVRTKPAVNNIMPAITYWVEHYKDNPAFLYVNERPVFFTWDSDALLPEEWAEIKRRTHELGADPIWVAEFNMYMADFKEEFSETVPTLARYQSAKAEFPAYMHVFDGVYSFAAHPSVSVYSHMLDDWAVRMPVDDRFIVGADYMGYYCPWWKKGESNPRNGTETARRIWELNQGLDLDWTVFTTWNEYNENTCLEPTVHNGGCQLALANYYNSLKKGSPRLLDSKKLYLSYKAERLSEDEIQYEVLNIPSVSDDYSYRLTVSDESGDVLLAEQGRIDADKVQADTYSLLIPSGAKRLKPMLEILGDNLCFDQLGETAVLNAAKVFSDLTRHVDVQAASEINALNVSASVNGNTLNYQVTANAKMPIRNLYLYKNGTFIRMLNPERDVDDAVRVFAKMTWPAIQQQTLRDGRLSVTNGRILSASRLGMDEEDRIAVRKPQEVQWVSRGCGRDQDWDGILFGLLLEDGAAFDVNLGNWHSHFTVSDLPVSQSLNDEEESVVSEFYTKEEIYHFNFQWVDRETEIAPPINQMQVKMSVCQPASPPYWTPNQESYSFIAAVLEDSTVVFSDSISIPPLWEPK